MNELIPFWVAALNLFIGLFGGMAWGIFVYRITDKKTK